MNIDFFRGFFRQTPQSIKTNTEGNYLSKKNHKSCYRSIIHLDHNKNQDQGPQARKNFKNKLTIQSLKLINSNIIVKWLSQASIAKMDHWKYEVDS